jgi:hypothetical protein
MRRAVAVLLFHSLEPRGYCCRELLSDLGGLATRINGSPFALT